MPTIRVNRKVLDKLIGKKIADDKLKDRISMLGTDLESLDSNEIVVEIFPNRPDMLSEQGFGRALASFLGTKTGLREYKARPSGQKVIVDRSMKKVRPYTACAIAKNLHLDDDKIKELMDIQEKLHGTFCRNRKKAAMGFYPLEKIKPPIHFTSALPEEIVFRPLEHPEKINARQILEVHPTGKAYAHLVEGFERFAIFKDSSEEILSFTPIINSHLTGRITEDTREAFLEVSGFDQKVCNDILNILVCTLADMGADIFTMEVVYPDGIQITPDLKPKEWKIDPNFVNKHLGLDLKENDLKILLEKMGYAYSKGIVKVPPYRADIMHQIDFTEDIATAYGYENFIPEIPSISTIGAESPRYIFQDRVADILVGSGLLECSTLHLINRDKQTKWMKIDHSPVEIVKSVSKEHDSLRTSLVPVMLEILAGNKHNEYPQKLFTIGRVFFGDKKEETNVREDMKLCAISSHTSADYTELLQILDYLFRMIDKEYKVLETENPSYIPGRCAKIIYSGREIGIIGELDPEVLSNFQLIMPASAFEINLDMII